MVFSSPEALHTALQKDGIELHGHKLAIAPSSQNVPEDARTAFILNLAETVTKESLEQLFEPCGRIINIELPLNQDSSAPKVSLHHAKRILFIGQNFALLSLCVLLTRP